MKASSARAGLGRPATTGLGIVVGLASVLAVALLVVAGAQRVDAITLTQAEAPIPAQTADPHQGNEDGVADADTKEPTQAETPNNIVLLVAALGVLIGILIVARPRRGPKS